MATCEICTSHMDFIGTLAPRKARLARRFSGGGGIRVIVG